MDSIVKKLQNAFQAFEKGRMKQAEILYLECIDKIEDKDSLTYKQALHGLGFVKSEQKNYKEAKELYSVLLRIAQQQGNKQDEAIAFHQLGMVERLLGNDEEALQYFSAEVDIYETNEGTFQLGRAAAYYEQGMIFLKQNQIIQAKQYMARSLQEAKQTSDLMVIGHAYQGLGETSSQANDNEAARMNYQHAADTFRQAGELELVKEIEAKINKL